MVELFAAPLGLLSVAFSTLLLDRKESPPKKAEERRWNWFNILATVALILQSGLLFLALFEPGLPYLVSKSPADSLHSEQFYRTLAALTDGWPTEGNRIQILQNGAEYYPAELAAIASAQKTICLEAYIFSEGKVARQFMDALVERARAGVAVKMVIDAVGSAAFPQSEIDRLTDAGGEFAWYLPPRWYTWPRLNHRAHRELLLIDGRVGFVGGSGWADHWLEPEDQDESAWRDAMVRIEGPAVAGLVAAFAENWLEAAGSVLTGTEYFNFEPGAGGSSAIVVRSSPTTGRSTSARVLFQVLLASARERIYIATPYFLPDDSLRDELRRAMMERNVEVRIITPGPGTDHMLTRRSSRRLFGPLLEAGARIYEYQPSMMHAKIMVVDGLWSVIGSTNMDPRSFTLNDEVNLVTPDAAIAQRLERDFLSDLQRSKEVSYEEWKNRGIAERLHEAFGGLIERQQ